MTYEEAQNIRVEFDNALELSANEAKSFSDLADRIKEVGGVFVEEGKIYSYKTNIDDINGADKGLITIYVDVQILKPLCAGVLLGDEWTKGRAWVTFRNFAIEDIERCARAFEPIQKQEEIPKGDAMLNEWRSRFAMHKIYSKKCCYCSNMEDGTDETQLATVLIFGGWEIIDDKSMCKECATKYKNGEITWEFC